jgi:hypothetical protein
MRYTLLLLCLCLVSLASERASAGGLPEQPADIGYSSPTAALQALRTKPGVIIREENGWYVATDPSDYTLWSIAQPSNPAYPTAVKRTVVQSESVVSVRMKVLCGASKQVCDHTVQLFQQLNNQIRQSMQH